jgi:hypothetical protein
VDKIQSCFYVKGDGTYCNHCDLIQHRIILVRKLSLWLNILVSETILERSVPASVFITCFLVHSLQLQIPESHGDVVFLQYICFISYWKGII